MESIQAKITEMKIKLEESKKLSEERRKIMQEEENIFHDTMVAELAADRAEMRQFNHSYEQLKIQRKQNAELFCQGKTADQLKEYLADQPVAYNVWKDLDLDELLKLTLEVYYDVDEEY